MCAPHILSNVIKVLSAITLVAMALISIFFYHVSIISMLIFLAFLVFYVLLPGILIASAAEVNTKHFSSDLLICSLLGWALIVLEYFICELVGSDVILYSLGPIISALLVINFRQLKPRLYLLSQKPRPSKISAGFLLFAVLLSAYVLLHTQYLYMNPEYSSSIYVSMDKGYQMGLISSLTNGYPIANPWVADRTVYYHIFSQVFLSVPMRLFNLTPDFLVMSCHPIVTVYLFGLSIYSMFRYFCKRKELAGVYSLTVMLSHMFIGRSITNSYLFRIMLTNENYGGSAVAGVIGWVIMLDIYLQHRNEKTKKSLCHLAYIAIFTMLLTGIKAPVGLVMVGGLIGTYILGIILRRMSIKDLPMVLIAALSFFIIYKLMLGSDGTAGVGENSIIGFGEISGICFWKKGFVDIMKSVGLPLPVRHAFVLLSFSLVFFSAFMIPFVIGYLREFVLVLRRKVAFDITKVTIYAAAFVGFSLMIFLRYYGHSQIYFGCVASVFAPQIAFWFFEDVDAHSSLWMLRVRKFSAISFIVIICVSSVTLAGCYSQMVPSAIDNARNTAKHNKYRSMTSKEYDAVKWIRNNISKDSLIATQMYASVKYDGYDYENRWHNCHFAYASYSGRYFYLEGSGYSFTYADNELRKKMVSNTNALFDADNPERGKLAKSLGVDYVMVTEYLHPIKNLSSDEYVKVFENSDVIIYKII